MKYALMISKSKYNDQKTGAVKNTGCRLSGAGKSSVAALCAFPIAFFFFLGKDKLQVISPEVDA
jgi:hypothetical protein